MDNYLIYEDEEQRVEILGAAHEYFKNSIVKSIEATKGTYNFLISLVLTDIKDLVPLSKITKREIGITLCHQIPVLQPYKGLCFRKPFNIFEEAFEFLSLTPDIYENPDELMNDIEEYYTTDSEFKDEGKIRGRIYSKPYKEVAGYFCFITEKEVFILFYGYESEESIEN